jgi:choline dehydrogenase
LAGNVTLDLNHWQVAGGKDGAFIPPMSVNRDSKRSGIREYLLENRARYPDRLIIRTGALATRVLFDDRTAVGVEYLHGSKLYKADAYYNEQAAGVLKQVRASREVILAGGAFNSPQLLKLSGIGPASELQQHGIPVKVDLPGVGENLQDRYEVSVVYDLKEELDVTKDCTFGGENDPCLARYKNNSWSRGPYSSNGLSLALVERSKPELQDPDLFLFSLPVSFHGYYPGYSNEVVDYKSRFSWLVLKGHTNNSAGRVSLASNNPQDMPEINFHYFDEGNDVTGDDLHAVVRGVKSIRQIMDEPLAKRHVQQEALPGAALQSDEAIGDFVKNEAWGHHASCSNKIGVAGDPSAVVDSRFRVIGTKNLRVVDASVFPYIPGFFIITPTYMISEKASDVILEDVLRNQ